MKSGEGNTDSGRWLKSTLVLLIIYFGQIFPYVHFHDSHPEQNQFSTSDLHSLSTTSGAFPNRQDRHHHHSYTEHEGDDRHHESDEEHEHHHVFERNIDSHWFRSHKRGILLLAGYSVLFLLQFSGGETIIPA